VANELLYVKQNPEFLLVCNLRLVDNADRLVNYSIKGMHIANGDAIETQAVILREEIYNESWFVEDVLLSAIKVCLFMPLVCGQR
jgi:hypothetical protein